MVRERLAMRGFTYDELRVELIGVESLHGPAAGRPEPYETRLRVAGRTQDRKAAEAVGLDLETLYTNGPAGGAGAFSMVQEVFAVQSVLLPRELVTPTVQVEQAA